MKIEIEIDETMAVQTQLMIRKDGKQNQSHIDPEWAGNIVQQLLELYVKALKLTETCALCGVPADADYFGVCPTCHQTEGCLNIGRGHWGFCKEHRVKWFFGENLLSGWRDETEAFQRKRYDDLGFGDFTNVEPHLTVGAFADAAFLESYRAEAVAVPSELTADESDIPV
jgi:hypothetical protein